jgi:hypothetical protein
MSLGVLGEYGFRRKFAEINIMSLGVLGEYGMIL